MTSSNHADQRAFDLGLADLAERRGGVRLHSQYAMTCKSRRNSV